MPSAEDPHRAFRAARQAGKAALAFALDSGPGRAWMRRRVPDLVVVFLWHGLTDSTRSRDLFFDQDDVAAGRSSLCPLSSFRAHLDFIQARFEVVSLHEAAARLGAGRPFGRLAALTFDDGLSSVCELAVPELTARGLPACLFVNAALAGGARLKDGDIVNYARNRLGAAVTGRVWPAAGIDAATAAPGPQQSRRVVRHPRWPEARARLLDALGCTEAALARETRAYATWDELATLARPQFSVGNHGAEHLYLPSLGPIELEREILGGADEIRTRLGADDQPYAHAFGGPADFPNGALAVARRAHRVMLSGWGGFNAAGRPLDRLLRVPVFSTPKTRQLVECAFPLRQVADASRATPVFR